MPQPKSVWACGSCTGRSRRDAPRRWAPLYYEKCKVIERAHRRGRGRGRAPAREHRRAASRGARRSASAGASWCRSPFATCRASPGGCRLDISFDDRYVDLVEQGIDVAMRMGQMADSTLGARYLGANPWVMVDRAEYLAAHGEPRGADRPGPARLHRSTAACRATTAGASCRQMSKARVGARRWSAASEQPLGGARRRPCRPGARHPALVCGAGVDR